MTAAAEGATEAAAKAEKVRRVALTLDPASRPRL